MDTDSSNLEVVQQHHFHSQNNSIDIDIDTSINNLENKKNLGLDSMNNNNKNIANKQNHVSNVVDMISPKSSPMTSLRKSKNLKNLQLNLSNRHQNLLSLSTNQEILTPTDSPQNNIIQNSFGSANVQTHSNKTQKQDQSVISLSTSSSISSSISAPKPVTESESESEPSQILPPPPLRTFRRMPSFTPSSPSIGSFTSASTTNNSNNTNTRKRSATTLAINIPKNALGGDMYNENLNGPLTSSIKENNSKSINQILTQQLNNEQHINNIQNSLNTSRLIPNLPFDKPLKHQESRPSSLSSLSPSSASTLSSSPSPLNTRVNNSTFIRNSNHSQSYSSEIKPQTIPHLVDESKIDETNIDNYKKAYPDGPICVLTPNLYLYSEPTLEQISGFDIIINVAQEITDYSHQAKNQNVEYYFIPWTHTSKLAIDFPLLTTLIDTSLNLNKKILIHCQCGVSRSASLIIAYFMKKFNCSYNDAYSRLKEKVPQISPNLSLIYELIEWQEYLENQK